MVRRAGGCPFVPDLSLVPRGRGGSAHGAGFGAGQVEPCGPHPAPGGQGGVQPSARARCLLLDCSHDIESRLLITWQLPWLCQSPPRDAAVQDAASAPQPRGGGEGSAQAQPPPCREAASAPGTHTAGAVGAVPQSWGQKGSWFAWGRGLHGVVVCMG